MQGTRDILGHEAILRQLWGAVSRGALHHAYLLEGPQGVGKHAVALRLAMAANCEASTQGSERPCGSCATCRHIAAGTHPDVITLQPDPGRASGTIGVDEVREVIRKTGYTRYDSRQRFILVDPAEAMQPAASNALLKTLEEPPAGTGFLLVSHNASALLPTIRSRCQRVRFGVVEEAVIAGWLQQRGCSDRVELVARLAQGCPGRALALAEGGLDERLAVRDRLLDVLGGRLPDIFDWSTGLTKGRRQDWRARVDALVEVLEDLLRDVVVHGSGADLPLLNADRPDVVARWAQGLWPGGVAVCERAIADLRDDLEVNVTGKTALDALVTRLATELGPARRMAG